MLRVILFFPATKVFGFIYIQFTVFASFTFIFIITHHHHHNNKQKKKWGGQVLVSFIVRERVERTWFYITMYITYLIV